MPCLPPTEDLMETIVNRSISELAQQRHGQAGSDAELFAAFSTVREGSQVNELLALLKLWSQAEQGPGVSDRTMAELYFMLAARSSGAHARELCRTALDWFPAHVAALSLFEELVDESWADELCARYQTFIEDAPLHGVPPQAYAAVREKLILAELEAALNEIGQLPSGSSVGEAPLSGLMVELRQ